jgi:hypothetical protein
MLLAVATAGTAAYLFWNIDRRDVSIAADAHALDTRAATAVRMTFDLRSAQQGYVAAGQSEQFWIANVTAASPALRESLTALRATSTTASGRVALDGALEALQNFERMDRRAREYAAGDQKLLASDLIFSDGLESTEEIITALEQARYVEVADAGSSRSAGRRDQLMYAGGGVGVMLLALLLLTPAPKRDEAVAIEAGRSVDAARAEGRVYNAIEIDDVPEPFEFRPIARPQIQLEPEAAPLSLEPPPAAPEAADVEAQPPLVAESPEPAPDLEAVASVCRDLARLADTTSLPSLLERTAGALDASGVMLWVADPDGRELTAIAAHGYPKNMLSRIGTIKKEAENVTAAAFRTGMLQVVTADADSPGAIAVPLVNPSGCMGVMSAEVLRDGERQPARLAVATIVAAQLATLVAPATRVQQNSQAV